MPKVFIVTSGGLVNSVYTDSDEECEVEVIDCDEREDLDPQETETFDNRLDEIAVTMNCAY